MVVRVRVRVVGGERQQQMRLRNWHSLQDYETMLSSDHTSRFGIWYKVIKCARRGTM